MIACLAMVVMLTGCGKVVPPGKTVIVLKPNGDTKVIDKGVYKKLGRDRVYFVDKKLRSFEEDMQVLCADDINMAVDVKAVMSFAVSDAGIDFIREKVPSQQVTSGDVQGQELSLDKFYAMAVRDIVRSSARNTVSAYQTDDIRPNRQKLEKDIAQTVKQRVAELGYPINVSAVLISNIDYPQSVTAMREQIKQAQLEDQRSAALAEAKLAEAERQVLVETELAKVRMVRAQAQADENLILTESLTPQFLQWRQYEVMEQVGGWLADGTSNTVFMMPYEAMGAPIAQTVMMRESMDKVSTALASDE